MLNSGHISIEKCQKLVSSLSKRKKMRESRADLGMMVRKKELPSLFVKLNDLQTILHTLHNTTNQFGMRVSPPKSKVMTFKGEAPIKCKIVTNNTMLEQETTFTHLECKILGIIKSVLKPNLFQRHSQMNIYISAIPSVLYDCKIWAFK